MTERTAETFPDLTLDPPPPQDDATHTIEVHVIEDVDSPRFRISESMTLTRND